jgi:hypothetical protein
MDSVKLFDDWWDSAGAGLDRDWFRSHIRAAWIAGYNTPRSDNAEVEEINLALLDEVKSLQADATKRGTSYRRSPVTGWKWAKCEDCGTEWKETVRDIHQQYKPRCPSGCDHGGDAHVYKSKARWMPTDGYGNLQDIAGRVIIAYRPRKTTQSQHNIT